MITGKDFFKIVVIAGIIVWLTSGCFTNLDAVRQTDYREWTAEDCMAIIMNNTRHNLRQSGERIYTIVTPFTPEVVKAIGRIRQIKENISDSLTYEFVMRLTKDGTGVYMDAEGTLWDTRGNRFTGSRDSLLVMVNLINQTWPCEPPKIDGIPMILMSNMPCEIPDITGLGRQIFLRTVTGDTLYPTTL